MTDKELFLKILKKAIDNGYKDTDDLYDCYNSPNIQDNIFSTYLGIDRFIFSHEFAKAFWGEEYIYAHTPDIITGVGFIHKLNKKGKIVNSIELGNLKEWEYRLQQMVLEKEPLKYLEKFL